MRVLKRGGGEVAAPVATLRFKAARACMSTVNPCAASASLAVCWRRCRREQRYAYDGGFVSSNKSSTSSSLFVLWRFDVVLCLLCTFIGVADTHRLD